MRPIPPRRANTYTGGLLDRVSHLRKDEAWLARAWTDPAARVVPGWRTRGLVTDAGTAASLPVAWGAALLADHAGLPWLLLGLDGAAPVFALDLSQFDTPVDMLPPGAGTFEDLRPVASRLPETDAALLAYARAMLTWRSRTRFCSQCGAACVPAQAGHVMVCSACGTEHFPRTDPTVIMLVEHEGRALLGHSARFPNLQMYSTLAGFVEPGESLEEAVAREVMEEAGIRVGQVLYHSSQPWPYPLNLMLGFHAEALSEAITIDPTELTDARWFSRAELRDPQAHGFLLPPVQSIARRLIEDWVEFPG